MTITDRQRLIIRDTRSRTIGGINQSGVPIEGAFLGEPVTLGELRTDSSGRLMVLGGLGRWSAFPTRPADQSRTSETSPTTTDGATTCRTGR